MKKELEEIKKKLQEYVIQFINSTITYGRHSLWQGNMTMNKNTLYWVRQIIYKVICRISSMLEI